MHRDDLQIVADSEIIRQRAIKAIEAGIRPKGVARIFKVGVGSVRSWCGEYESWESAPPTWLSAVADYLSIAGRIVRRHNRHWLR